MTARIQNVLVAEPGIGKTTALIHDAIRQDHPLPYHDHRLIVLGHPGAMHSIGTLLRYLDFEPTRRGRNRFRNPMVHQILHVVPRTEATVQNMRGVPSATPVWVDDIDTFDDPEETFGHPTIVLATARPCGPWLAIEEAQREMQRLHAQAIERQRQQDHDEGLRLLMEAAIEGTPIAGVDPTKLGRAVREQSEAWS